MFETEVVPMIKAAPGVRPVAIFEEMLRRHPELGAGIRRTPERRIRAWRRSTARSRRLSFARPMKPARLGLVTLADHGLWIHQDQSRIVCCRFPGVSP